jgi:hypothetical protein
MPNRIIKESICASDTIDGLSWFEEVLFYRLMVNVDDYGRFDARTAILKARLFPLKSSVTEKQIEQAIVRMNETGILIAYTVSGKPYLQLSTWAKHQSIRNKRSKYPSADERDDEPHESNCIQLQSTACKCPRNPIQSESNPNPNPTPAQQESAFCAFWTAYPNKKAKPVALKVWKKLNPDIELINIIMFALYKHKGSEQWTKDNGQFIPHPATWLNQRRWEDKIISSGKKNNFQSYDQGETGEIYTGPDLLKEAREARG